MKKNVLNWIKLSFVAFLLVSCASSNHKQSPKQNKSAHLTNEQIKKLNQQTMDKVSSRLKELSIAAKASGPDKVRYLASDLYLKASAAQMEGDYQTANLIYTHLLDLVPNDTFVKKKFAVSLIRTGELEKSEKLLSSLYKEGKRKDNQIGLILAGVYSSLGQSDKSKKVYKRILKVDAKNEDACVFLGKTYALENKFNKALSTLKGCERRIKKKGIFSYYIGKMYVDKGKLNKALKYFKRASKLEPEFSQATMALGLVYEEQKKNEKAIRTYKAYLKKFPNDTLILTRIVQLMFSGEKFSEVIPYAERLSDYEPDNLNLKVKLGILYTDAKQYNKAISTFRDLLVQVPKNDKIMYYLGAIYQETEEFEKAIEQFTQINVDSGLYHDSSVQVAQMLSTLAQGEFYSKKERGDFHTKFIKFVDNKIDELAKLKVEFSVIKAGYFENIENYNLSIDSLEVVSAEEGFNENHKYYLASLYEKQGEFKKSEGIMWEILDKDPKNAHAWNFLGYSLVERGTQLDKAYEYINKAVSLNPKDGYIRDSLGWYYFKVGEVDKALVELKSAVAKAPKDVSIQKHLAVVYTSKKQFAKAKKFIVEALKHVKQESERQELYDALKQLESKRIPASFK